MIPMIGAWLAKSALMSSPAGPILKKLWKPIAGGLIVLALVSLHQCHAHKMLKAADKAGYDRREAEIIFRAQKLKAKADALTRKIVEQERALNDQAHRANNAAADALLLRGPGQAICSVRSGASGAAVRPTGGPPVAVNGSVDSLLDPGGQPLIALPFNDNVAFAREHDSCQIDRKSWERWHNEVLKVWPKQ